MATTMEKNVTYNAQGDAIYSNATTNSTYPTTSSSSYTTRTTYTGANQNVQSMGTVADNPSLTEDSAKGKFLRFYNKVENSMRKKWDSSSGPSSRTDPLGGYTVKGPGYYEKKHKFTRRITQRGAPPPGTVPVSATSHSTYTSATPAYSSSSSSYNTSSTPAYSSSSSYNNPSYTSSTPSYSTPSAPHTAAPHSPATYTTPSVPVM